MPRYFFHIRTDSDLVRDAEGSDLPDEVAAKIEGEAAAREMLAEAVRKGEMPDTRCLEICDEWSRLIAEIRFSDLTGLK